MRSYLTRGLPCASNKLGTSDIGTKPTKIPAPTRRDRAGFWSKNSGARAPRERFLSPSLGWPYPGETFLPVTSRESRRKVAPAVPISSTLCGSLAHCAPRHPGKLPRSPSKSNDYQLIVADRNSGTIEADVLYFEAPFGKVRFIPKHFIRGNVFYYIVSQRTKPAD